MVGCCPQNVFKLNKIVHILGIIVMYNILRVLIASGVSPWNRIKESGRLYHPLYKSFTEQKCLYG